MLPVPKCLQNIEKDWPIMLKSIHNRSNLHLMQLCRVIEYFNACLVGYLWCKKVDSVVFKSE